MISRVDIAAQGMETSTPLGKGVRRHVNVKLSVKAVCQGKSPYLDTVSYTHLTLPTIYSV